MRNKLYNCVIPEHMFALSGRDEGYSRNVPCTLKWIYTLFL